MRRKLLLFVLVAMLLLSCAATASAQGFERNRTGSITVTLDKAMAGAKFDVYSIATVDYDAGKLFYAYTQDFRDSNIALRDSRLASKLSDYIAEKKITTKNRITVGTDGKGTLDKLPLGLYLVKRVEAVEGYSTCTPFLVTLPKQEINAFVYDVDASPKMDIIRLVDITVKKVWNSGKSSTAGSVKVQLLRDDKVVETATLNKDNNWQITYKDMPASDTYKIKEVDVPSGYTATYSQKDYVFTVTNTASLAQTGQLIWPIPVLALAGLFFLLLGFVILRKPGKSDA